MERSKDSLDSRWNSGCCRWCRFHSSVIGIFVITFDARAREVLIMSRFLPTKLMKDMFVSEDLAKLSLTCIKHNKNRKGLCPLS
mmetsp:Transcript_23317/g.48463  ORF Transcript_23317/g.48463 Transcript_23317/m.48463 type:complete len:84 (+) Transcript_23317:1014-1265(+)